MNEKIRPNSGTASRVHFPKKLKFFFGTGDMAGYGVLFDGSALWHSDNEVTLSNGRPYALPCAVSDEQWEHFWQEVERIGVWQWQAHYDNPGVLDGSQWSLELEFGGKQVKCGGCNAYPGAPEGPEFSADCAFGQFMAALRRLTEVKEV